MRLRDRRPRCAHAHARAPRTTHRTPLQFGERREELKVYFDFDYAPREQQPVQKCCCVVA